MTNTEDANGQPADEGKLTPAQQLDNWRNMLVGMIGPYALLMSESDIQAYKDKMQRALANEKVS